jgi:hypothetical protein
MIKIALLMLLFLVFGEIWGRIGSYGRVAMDYRNLNVNYHCPFKSE